ncbi:hypothetical protein [Microcoleus sp. PH2017_27_LUM_O_A]|uniref:hypothetical protein n=1 Tax=Microcoleus sp. PH2017_27_LUM_O_A TaxID=2798837 RepID=UPI0025CE2B10|nr:hypothetical protein [Microcoleus sp. PH2017_27_LUM_O_A]
MVFYKVKILRCYNSPKIVTVTAKNSQQAVRAAAADLRAEGVTDARGIEVIGQVKSLRG